MTSAMRCVWSFSVLCPFFSSSSESRAEFSLMAPTQVIHESVSRIGCWPTVTTRSIQQRTRMTLYIPVTLLLLVRNCECFIIEILVGSKSHYEVNMPFSLRLLAYYCVVLWEADTFIYWGFSGYVTLLSAWVINSLREYHCWFEKVSAR